MALLALFVASCGGDGTSRGNLTGPSPSVPEETSAPGVGSALPGVTYGRPCAGVVSPLNPFPCCGDEVEGIGNCTWWMWELAYKNWGVDLCRGEEICGDAYKWGREAEKADYQVGEFPAIGAIAVREDPTLGGHVAWVTDIKCGNTTPLEVSESSCCRSLNNWCGKGSKESARDHARPHIAFHPFSYFSRYIYRKGSVTPTSHPCAASSPSPPPAPAPPPSPTPTPTPVPVTVSLTANPSTINPGQSSTLSWSSVGATSCLFINGLFGVRPLAGTEVVSPSSTTTYTISCSNDLSLTRASVTISVSSPSPTPTPTPTPTPPPSPAPAAPSNLLAVALSSSWTSLTWTDNSGNESGFKIERRTGGVFFAQVGIQSQNLNFYNDTGLSAGTTYCYRARAYNSTGDSAYSNQSCATTQSVPPPPSPTPTPTPPAPTPQLCNYVLSPVSQNVSPAGDTFSTTVTRTSGSCGWNASVSAPWITLPGGSSGATTAALVYNVSANASSASRTGTITVTWSGGGAQLTVSQSGTIVTSSYSVAGSESAAARFTVDNFLRVYLNARLIGEFGNTPGDMVGPATFQGRSGDSLTIEAYDDGGNRLLGPLWLYRNGERLVKLTDGISPIFGQPCCGPPVLFFRQTYTLP